MQERGEHISREANHLVDNLLLTSEEHRIAPARAIRNYWLQSHAPEHAPKEQETEERKQHGELPGANKDRAGMVF
ncbi:hypothetical protein AK812_SmicGene1033 [Symbiodinium microadriaticum]|uniref:Uncharacterized protein n=1 Tax=Symbiodinium microadriaticum TaxID=2951 RepID=A0A1Q9F564_SYMMI|nr:hypothetical protein AK812_SmicGene1033 [Symbiodinium microadriaticum]